MLKELTLHNWKSFKEATLYIDPLTIIIGTNASGKSNMLDALLFLQRVSSGVGIFQAINGDINLPSIRGGMEWVCHKPEKFFGITLLLDGDKKNQDYRYELKIQINGAKAEIYSEELAILKYGKRSETQKISRLFNTQLPEERNPVISAYFSTGTQGRGKKIDLNRSHLILTQADTLNLRKEVQDGIKNILLKLQQIFVFDPIPSHMRGYTPFSEKLQADGSNIAGVLAALDKTRKDEVEGIITTYLQGLPEKDIKRIWTEPVGKFQTDAMLYCEEGWPGTASDTIDARGMSDGTLRYLAIVTAMLTRQSGGLLVIEEVDNGLHPSRAHVLINMLRTLGQQRGIDVIVTTHNPALLDAAGPKMIPFISVTHRDDISGESLLTQLDDIQQLPKLMASGSLGRLSSEGRIEAALKQGEKQ
ncbi:AAA family ATPase [Dickeya oryzae]|uniref:AAA family ATPase n=1 Tax=Dickeya oryzae TaxID=1240404 RepID=A0AB39IV25_9GAMM|nr:ATP-binding protein [Dickeya oryzae]MBP2857798.1 AAA family ATPase [Dickeya oryzae]MCA6990187.1 AAA family ATPase [Dickeya oryzae]